ncbi:MAG: 4-hydroxy-3-methylbut-2-enyl diphosphate reductase [Clostridiaceae bacterium]|nr:4-hydroxy-3-methylbut-2-enyl diphosphate reductase [Clostridiaceae bacterium]
MEVILADNSGFCFGVEKAMNTTFKEINSNQDKKNILSLGPLIHNKQVVEELEDKGVKVIDNLEEIPNGSVIIRSHGVPEKIYEVAKSKKLNVIDTTCPFVRRIQKIVKDYHTKGYEIVIIGNPKHPEVIGINGWCDNKATVIKEEEDINKMHRVDKLCIVVQTTMSVSHFIKISQELENYADEVIKFNTICLATKERQKSARSLAEKVDAMIVIGGYHSSNTQKLVSICKEIKPNSTYHVETKENLPIELLKCYNIVGVTAGASTPKWIINEIVKKLNSI